MLQVDACGLKCPLPILRTKKALATLSGGDRVEVLSTDPTSVRDFEAFCRQAGHTLVECCEADGRFRFVLEKRRDADSGSPAV
ncbi:MAG: sulfurtransferase TusA family protein [Rhodocyclaceae bacterium]|nr:sulfurtransferase TusA family protein [Rhodocyclaceae bacterium]